MAVAASAVSPVGIEAEADILGRRVQHGVVQFFCAFQQLGGVEVVGEGHSVLSELLAEGFQSGRLPSDEGVGFWRIVPIDGIGIGDHDGGAEFLGGEASLDDNGNFGIDVGSHEVAGDVNAGHFEAVFRQRSGVGVELGFGIP